MSCFVVVLAAGNCTSPKAVNKSPNQEATLLFSTRVDAAPPGPPRCGPFHLLVTGRCPRRRHTTPPPPPTQSSGWRGSDFRGGGTPPNPPLACLGVRGRGPPPPSTSLFVWGGGHLSHPPILSEHPPPMMGPVSYNGTLSLLLPFFRGEGVGTPRPLSWGGGHPPHTPFCFRPPPHVGEGIVSHPPFFS